jgi:hypothetical protein
MALQQRRAYGKKDLLSLERFGQVMPNDARGSPDWRFTPQSRSAMIKNQFVTFFTIFEWLLPQNR